MTYQPFVKGIKIPITFEQDLRAKIVTIYVKNKMIKQWTEVSKTGDFEHPFHHSDGDLKMEIKWDEEKEEEVLYLDGKEHDQLPWLSPDFRLDETELPVFQTTLYVGSKSISSEYKPFEWEPHVLQHMITEKLGNNPIDSFNVQYMC